jgi:chloramphenicol-sensitive protein RarD
VNTVRRGYLFAFVAYALWGIFPLYFKALRPAGAFEILAQRVVWSAVFVAILLTVVRRWRALAELRHQPRKLALVGAASVFIAVNWYTYISGVNSGHVVETSLGYFINPLVTVLLGVFALRERLRALQWVAVGIGAAAVAVLTADYGRLPLIALVLACSFGMYGFIKKQLALPAADGLFLESSALTLPALAYLIVIGARGEATFGSGSWHTVGLVFSGAATAIPLLLFAGAANRLTLTALGMVQYLAPTLQLLIGIAVYHEPMPPARWAGFGMVWFALLIFTWDALRTGAAKRRAAATTADEVETAPAGYGL